MSLKLNYAYKNLRRKLACYQFKISKILAKGLWLLLLLENILVIITIRKHIIIVTGDLPPVIGLILVGHSIATC